MDAILSTQESFNRYLQEGSRVYMCLYDLQKAFDSVGWHQFKIMVPFTQLV